MTARDAAPRRPSAALLGLALGDAIGAPFEGRVTVAAEDVRAWLTATRPLRWTDDTHMALALGRTLASHPDRLDPQRLGDAFARAYAEEPWRGYGAGPPRIFAMAREGVPYVDAAAALFDGTGSFGNGAAMRVAPVALVAGPDPARAADLAGQQARVTHTHPEAVDGAVAVARAVVLLGRQGRERAPAEVLADLPEAMRTAALRDGLRQVLSAAGSGRELEAARALGTGLPAREAVPAAVAAFLFAPDDLTDTIVAAVGLGGDTDTVAAMAGALAGAHLGVGAVPAPLLARLEARAELEELSAQLVHLASPGEHRPDQGR